MNNSRSLDELHPIVREKVECFLDECDAQGIDILVTSTYRDFESQDALYAQGRTKPGAIVTNMDGVKKKSKHNYSPSLAIDIAPWPIDWKDIERFKELAEVVKKAADTVGVAIQWGGDWKTFKDWPHWEIKG